MTERTSRGRPWFVDEEGRLAARPKPSVPPHVHRWLPAGLTHSGTVLVQSCECGVVRTVKVPG